MKFFKTMSQVWAGVGTAAVAVSAGVIAVAPYQSLLPVKVQQGIGVAGAIAGVIITARNQSLNNSHASVPLRKLESLPDEVLSRMGDSVVKQVKGE